MTQLDHIYSDTHTNKHIAYCQITNIYTVFDSNIFYFVDLEFDSIITTEQFTGTHLDVYKYIQSLVDNQQIYLHIKQQTLNFTMVDFIVDSETEQVIFILRDEFNSTIFVTYSYQKIGVKPKYKCGNGQVICNNCHQSHETQCVTGFVEKYVCPESKTTYIRNRERSVNSEKKSKYSCRDCNELHTKSEPITKWIQLQ